MIWPEFFQIFPDHNSAREYTRPKVVTFRINSDVEVNNCIWDGKLHTFAMFDLSSPWSVIVSFYEQVIFIALWVRFALLFEIYSINFTATITSQLVNTII